MYDGEESLPQSTLNTYLYTLQQQAPKPHRIICQKEVPQRPPFYGKEFHGNLSRENADCLLSQGDGCYLVRKSERAPDTFTLAIRFNGETKNFKLFYTDNKHYVGEKSFDAIHDLVADGLIHFYIESRASDYISALSKESNYEESPYLAYSAKRKRLANHKSRPLSSRRLDYPDGQLTSNDVPETVTEENDSLDISEDSITTDWKDIEKTHCFKVQNFMGLHWCDFCANFMWGLIAQGVKCQDCGFGAHKKCSEAVPNDCMPDMKYVKRIFGGDLTTVVKAQKSPVPVIVEKCIKEIESRGFENEGLYRIAGFHDDIEAVRMAFDKDGENTDIGPNKYDDINTISSALKLYFRLLPIPLITFDVYKHLLDAIKRDDPLSAQIKLVKETISSLPPAHYQTLKYLGSHLLRVTEHKNKNLMGVENLSIIFAPTLMRPMETDPMVSLMAAKYEHKVIEFILLHFREIFGK